MVEGVLHILTRRSGLTGSGVILDRARGVLMTRRRVL